MASISPPVRVFALVAVLAAVGYAGFVFLTGRSQAAELTAAPTPTVDAGARQAGSRGARARPAHGKRPYGRPRAAFPRQSIGASYNRVVVIALYLPGAAVDAQVRAEARAGAARARVGFVALSARERAARPPPGCREDRVLPAAGRRRRPPSRRREGGRSAVTDAGTVAQAALQAKS